MTRHTADFVLRGGTVVTQDDAGTVLEPGWVAISDGRVAAIGSGDHPPAEQVDDLRDHILLPGFVNAHSHLMGAFVRGMGGDTSTTVEASSERPTVAIRLAMDEEDAYVASRLAIFEMQLSGVTSTTDSQVALLGLEGQADGTLRALSESGMRSVFFRSSIDRSEFFPSDRHDEAESAAAESDRLGRLWANERVTIGVEPMALHRVSDSLLHQLVDLARDRGVPLALHGPYNREAAHHAFDRWGVSVIGKLQQVGALGHSTLIHHPVVVSDRDIAALASTDTAVSVCAVDNMLIGTSSAALGDLLEAEVRVGIGLDQPNDGHNMFELMKLTLLVQRMNKGPWGSPGVVLDLATNAGARAIGVETGSIEVGAWADIVVIDGRHPTMHPRPAAPSNLVLAANPQSIRSVYTMGRLTVDRGRHLTWDRDEVVDAATDAMRRCLERTGLSHPASWGR